MEDAKVNEFRNKIMGGEFDTVSQTLLELQVEAEEKNRIEYQIFEQKYLELLEQGKKLEAIHILQNELAPRVGDLEKLHGLAQLIICGGGEQNGGGGSSISAIQKELQE